MVRPLLIALLTVTAVACPVAALGPLPLPPVEPSPVAVDPDAFADTTLVESFHPLLALVSVSSTAAVNCSYVDVHLEDSDGPVPTPHVDFDPEDCLSRQINYVLYTVACVVERLPLADSLVDLGSTRQSVQVQFLDLATGRPVIIIGTC